MQLNNKNSWVFELFKEADMIDERNLIAQGYLFLKNNKRFRDKSFGRKMFVILSFPFKVLWIVFLLLSFYVPWDPPPILYITINGKQIFMLRKGAFDKKFTAPDLTKNVFHLETEGLCSVEFDGKNLRLEYHDNRKAVLEMKCDGANVFETIHRIYKESLR